MLSTTGSDFFSALDDDEAEDPDEPESPPFAQDAVHAATVSARQPESVLFKILFIAFSPFL